MSLLESSRPTSILLIEPHGGCAMKVQDMLAGHCHAAFDLGTARSLREGMAHLSTHQVALVLMNLTLPDDNGLDAVHALRMTAPTSALIALSTINSETVLLDAIRAGAHEALSITTASAPEFRLAIDRAMARAGQPRISTSPSSPVQQGTLSPALPKLAHDLNNAITAINGFADILLTRLPLDEPARASAEQIRKAGARATALVKTLTPPFASSPSIQMSDPSTSAQAA